MTTRRLSFILTFALMLIIVQPTTTYYCSSYCETCSGIADNNCVTCPTGFNPSSSSCQPDATIYTSVLQTGNLTTNFDNTSITSCGDFSSIPGLYQDSHAVQVALLNIIPHFSMRVRMFILWIDTWDLTDQVSLTVDSMLQASAPYSSAFGDKNECQNSTVIDSWNNLDTEDFSHSAATANIAVSMGACPNSAQCNWALREVIVLVKACHLYCSTCTSALNTNCSACVNSYLLTNTTCDTTCGTSYYANSTQTCAACNSNCSTCTGSPTNCSVCNAGYYLLNNSCLYSCPAAYYINGSLCSACAANCASCTNNPTPCQSCNNSYFLFLSNFTCLSNCPDGYYNNSGVCAVCNGSCATCTSNPTPCQSCKSTFYLNVTSCGTTCPTGYFGNSTTNNCDQCDITCLTCQTSAANCTVCSSGYLFFTSNNTCMSNCPAGYYNSSGTCSSCNGSCATCTNSPSPCLSCKNSYYLNVSTCGTTCPTGTFGNSVTHNCDICNASCAVCSINATHCSACASSYVLFSSNSTCISGCPDGYYNNTGLCSTCNSNCVTCTGNPTPCQSCNPGSFLSSSACGSTCPPLTFKNSGTNRCDSCDAACLVCNNSPTNCSSCVASSVLFIQNYTCIPSCPNDYFKDTSLNQCVMCDVSCLLCTGTPSPCSSCNVGYYQYLTGCVSPCPAGYYANTSLTLCLPCNTGCAICTNSPGNCTACTSTYYLIVNSSICAISCPATLYYTVSNTCVNCDVGCKVCSGPSSNCSLCMPTYYYYVSSNLCTLTCPSHTASAANFTCVDCDSTCTDCILTSTNCTACIVSYSLFQSNTSCIQTCPVGYFSNSSNICQTCQTGCATCTGFPTPCQLCNASYYMYNGACGTTCPTGYWANGTTLNCDQCSTNCTSCTSAVTCQTCSSGYYRYLINSTCLSPCPTYYYNVTTYDQNYPTDDICYTRFCSPYCITGGCTDVAWNACTACSANYNRTGSVCYPDLTRYLILYEGRNDTSTTSNTSIGSCGQYISIPGLYYPSTTIQIYSQFIIYNHYKIRVRVGFIFIDDWGGGTISVEIDNNNSTWVSYNSAQTIQQQCNDTTPERGILSDTNEINHSTNSTTLKFISSGCANSATCRWAYREPIVMIVVCNSSCLTCYGTSSQSCTSCVNSTGGNYLLSNNTCALTCDPNSYQSGPNQCTFCVWNCTTCNMSPTNCSECRSGYLFWPDNSSCPLSCPNTYFNSTNVCYACAPLCTTCSDLTTCQTCVIGSYYNNYFCYDICPSPLFNDNYSMTCLTLQQYYVFLTIDTYFVEGDVLNIDLAFSQPIDFTTFPYQNWQTFNISSDSGVTMNNFQISYSIINDSAYSITLTANDFTFMTNNILTMVTNDSTTLYSSIYGRPFYTEDYNASISQTWSCIKISNMTGSQEDVISSFADVSTALNNATSGQYVQQAKKVGLALLVANSLQITSCMLLINTVLPKNMYESIRMPASLVFFDVPPYQTDLTAQKYFIVPPVSDLTSRRLLTINETNFARAGFTGYFLFDAYPQVIIICLLWVLMIPTYILRQRKYGQRIYGYVHSLLHKFTDLAIMYFTLTLLFQFAYFQDKQVRYISFVLCIVCNLYLLFYELYRYYDLAAYPYAEINTPEYQRFVTVYGSFLKNLRYVEYKPRKQGSWKFNWLQPSSYHIISYIKKLLMMFALAIFYEQAELQISALIIIQSLQIVRFCLIWPFRSKVYNFIRLSLEVCLLTLLACIAASIGLLNKIMSTPVAQITDDVDNFYLVGWVGFVLVFVFNGSFVLIFLYDFIQGCRYTNKEMIDMTRKEYYAGLLRKYEKGNEQVPERLLNDWAKRGMVDEQKQKRSVSGTKILCQSYTIRVDDGCYLVDIDKVVEFEKKRSFVLVNNAQFLIPSQSVQHQRMVEPDDDLFQLMDKVFHSYANQSTTEVVLKTYLYIDQTKYKIGEKVEIDDTEYIDHELIIRAPGSQQQIEVTEAIEGFPIPIATFKRLYLM